MPVTRAEHNFKIKVCAVEKRARKKNRSDNLLEVLGFFFFLRRKVDKKCRNAIPLQRDGTDIKL